MRHEVQHCFFRYELTQQPLVQLLDAIARISLLFLALSLVTIRDKFRPTRGKRLTTAPITRPDVSIDADFANGLLQRLVKLSPGK